MTQELDIDIVLHPQAQECWDQIRTLHPTARILACDETELAVELEFDGPSSEYPDGHSKLLLIIFTRTQPHFHQEATEIYKVIKGRGILVAAGQAEVLTSKSNRRMIAGQTTHHTVHYLLAIAEPFWVELVSTPPWTVENHFLV